MEVRPGQMELTDIYFYCGILKKKTKTNQRDHPQKPNTEWKMEIQKDSK